MVPGPLPAFTAAAATWGSSREASTAGIVSAAPSRPCMGGVLACYDPRCGGALLVDLAPGDLLVLLVSVVVPLTAGIVSAAPSRPCMGGVLGCYEPLLWWCPSC